MVRARAGESRLADPQYRLTGARFEQAVRVAGYRRVVVELDVNNYIASPDTLHPHPTDVARKVNR
ncbi:MAG: hypothetical protein M3513_09215 [Actinomycetota bacterium]|nr:hypothetical protein [Actinomycetota bacterium]